jgi:hypothetical protein
LITAEIDALLTDWRAQLAAGIETTEAELTAAEAELAEAKKVDRAARARWLALSTRISASLGRRPVPGPLQQRLDAEEPQTRAAAGAAAQARGRVAALHYRLGEQRDAVAELTQMLAPVEPPSPSLLPPEPDPGAETGVETVIVFPSGRAA